MDIEEFKFKDPAASTPALEVSKPPLIERVPFVAISMSLPPVVCIKPPKVIAASPSRSTVPAAIIEDVTRESVPDSKVTAPTEFIASTFILPALALPVEILTVSEPVPVIAPRTAAAPFVLIERLDPLPKVMAPFWN